MTCDVLRHMCVISHAAGVGERSTRHGCIGGGRCVGVSGFMRVTNLVFGVVCGLWFVWCVVCGVWCVVCEVCGVRCEVCGVRCEVCGVWREV